MAADKTSALTKSSSAPLLHGARDDDDETGPSEIPRISWSRAIGIFHLFIGWLIAELVGLCVRTDRGNPRRRLRGRAPRPRVSPREKTKKPNPSLTVPPSRPPVPSSIPISAVALTALVTDHWIVPTGDALPFVSHAGLWKVCFSAAAVESEGRVVAGVESFDDARDWWRTVDRSFLDVPDDTTGLEPGCTRRVAELYGHLWGRDYVAWLEIVRAFAILFLWTGALKIVVVARNYVDASRGRWLASALAVCLGVAQACFGEVAWFIMLAVVLGATRDAPAYLDRGTFAAYEGWSFWAFFAAAQWTLLVTSLYLFVEAGACCGRERRARFWTSGRRDARAGMKPKRRVEKNRDEETGATRARDDRDDRDDDADFKKRGKETVM